MLVGGILGELQSNVTGQTRIGRGGFFHGGLGTPNANARSVFAGADRV